MSEHLSIINEISRMGGAESLDLTSHSYFVLLLIRSDDSGAYSARVNPDAKRGLACSTQIRQAEVSQHEWPTWSWLFYSLLSSEWWDHWRCEVSHALGEILILTDVSPSRWLRKAPVLSVSTRAASACRPGETPKNLLRHHVPAVPHAPSVSTRDTSWEDYWVTYINMIVMLSSNCHRGYIGFIIQPNL